MPSEWENYTFDTWNTHFCCTATVANEQVWITHNSASSTQTYSKLRYKVHPTGLLVPMLPFFFNLGSSLFFMCIVPVFSAFCQPLFFFTTVCSSAFFYSPEQVQDFKITEHCWLGHVLCDRIIQCDSVKIFSQNLQVFTSLAISFFTAIRTPYVNGSYSRCIRCGSEWWGW